MLKQFIYIISFLLFWWSFSAQADIQKPAIISAHPSYPPIMWQQQDKMVGAAFKLIDHIFTKLSIEYIATPVGPWKRVHKSAKDGKIDIIAAAYMNSERKEYLLYSEWFMEDPVVLFVWHNRQFNYESWDDLIEKQGTTQLGESYGEAFDQYIKQNLAMDWEQKYINHFKKLEYGRVDYFLCGLYPGLIEVNKYGYEGKIIALKKHVVNEKFYITVSKKSPYASLLPKINQEIIKIRNTKLIEKWVEESMTYYKQSNQ